MADLFQNLKYFRWKHGHFCELLSTQHQHCDHSKSKCLFPRIQFVTVSCNNRLGHGTSRPQLVICPLNWHPILPNNCKQDSVCLRHIYLRLDRHCIATQYFLIQNKLWDKGLTIRFMWRVDENNPSGATRYIWKRSLLLICKGFIYLFPSHVHQQN